MALTKSNIIDHIESKLRYPRKKTVDTVETLIEIIKEGMENGDDVLISGFGKFCVRDKNKRKGRNPATGKAMILDARRVVTFKCSGKLRNKVNGKQKKLWWDKTLAEEGKKQ